MNWKDILKGKGERHFFEDGEQWIGETHKHPDGTLMSGKEHKEGVSKKLLHFYELDKEHLKHLSKETTVIKALKMQRRMRSHIHREDREMPIREEYKDSFPSRSIMDKGLEMLEDKLEELHKEAERTKWLEGTNQMYAFVDTPKVSILVIFHVQSNGVLALHMDTHSRSKAVDRIMQEVGNFYKSNISMTMLDYINR